MQVQLSQQTLWLVCQYLSVLCLFFFVSNVVNIIACHLQLFD